MNRRRYVATSLGLVGGSLAGCTAIAGETELAAPTETHDGNSVRLVYVHEGDPLVRVYFNKQPDTPWKSVNEIPDTPAFHRLRIGIEQPGDVRLDTYRFRFKPAGDGAANVYLHPPERGHEDTFDTYRDADWTVLEATYDDGTPVSTGFELLVYSGSVTDTADRVSIRVDHELTLSGGGYLDRGFIARNQSTIELEQAE